MTRPNRFAACGFGAAALLLASAAHAQTTQVMCNDTTMIQNPIILTGSTAFEATVKQFAAKLLAATTATSIIYQLPGSCSGVANFSAPLTGTAHYYTLDTTKTPAAVVSNNCTFGTGQMADVAISDVFYDSCTNVPQPIPATLKDFPGPVQAMLFVVPKANTTAQYLTAPEAAALYGCGAGAQIAGFTEATGIYCRDPNSGTQITIAKNIQVPASAIIPPLCVSGSGTGGVISGVEMYSNPQASIGFISADAFDAVGATAAATPRTQLSELAFQWYGQTKAYYADSDPSAFDRRNVRDGHYAIWGYEHMLAAVDGSGAITNPKAANFIGWINGTKVDASFDPVVLEAGAGTIPTCAMKVQRYTDGGPLAYYTPADPCGCAFEAAVTKMTPTGCDACTGTGASTCTGGKSCHHGFCE
jgi:ABC-type phosphate transport system substrate-binding protein